MWNTEKGVRRHVPLWTRGTTAPAAHPGPVPVFPDLQANEIRWPEPWARGHLCCVFAGPMTAAPRGQPRPEGRANPRSVTQRQMDVRGPDRGQGCPADRLGQKEMASTLGGLTDLTEWGVCHPIPEASLNRLFGEAPGSVPTSLLPGLREGGPASTFRAPKWLAFLLGDSRTSGGGHHFLLSTFNFIFNF